MKRVWPTRSFSGEVMAVLLAVIGMGVVFDVEQATGESVMMPVVSGTALEYADEFIFEDEVLLSERFFLLPDYRVYVPHEVNLVVDPVAPVEIIETVFAPTPIPVSVPVPTLVPTPSNSAITDFVAVEDENLEEIEDLISQIEDELRDLEDLDLLLDF